MIIEKHFKSFPYSNQLLTIRLNLRNNRCNAIPTFGRRGRGKFYQPLPISVFVVDSLDILTFDYIIVDITWPRLGYIALQFPI